MEDGVWRTVGGRRIFIKDGQSLSDAMKKSGKFKLEKKDIKVTLKKQLTEKQRKQKTVKKGLAFFYGMCYYTQAR